MRPDQRCRAPRGTHGGLSIPANLTAQYQAAEARFRAAQSNEEKIGALREMLAQIPTHKGTEKLHTDLKRRLSKLQEEQEQHRRWGGAATTPGTSRAMGRGRLRSSVPLMPGNRRCWPGSRTRIRRSPNTDTKEPGHKPDHSRPFVLKRGSTVMDLAALIHKDVASTFRFARVWGSAKFEWQS